MRKPRPMEVKAMCLQSCSCKHLSQNSQLSLPGSKVQVLWFSIPLGLRGSMLPWWQLCSPQVLEWGAPAGRVQRAGRGAAPGARCPWGHGGLPADPHPQLLLQVLLNRAAEAGQSQPWRCECGQGGWSGGKPASPPGFLGAEEQKPGIQPRSHGEGGWLLWPGPEHLSCCCYHLSLELEQPRLSPHLNCETCKRDQMALLDAEWIWLWIYM